MSAPTVTGTARRNLHTDGHPVGSPEVCDRAGITYRQFDFWCTRGYIEHRKAKPGSGYGKERWLTEAEAEVVVQAARLVAAGFVPSAAFPIARGLAAGSVELILVMLAEALGVTS